MSPTFEKISLWITISVTNGPGEQDVKIPPLGIFRDQPRDLESHGAAGDVVFVGDDDPEDFGETQGREGQVDAAHPQAQRADPESRQSGDERPDRHTDPRVHPELGRKNSRRVGADSGEGGVGERDLPGVARQEVPTGSHHHVEKAHDRHVHMVGSKPQGQEASRSGDREKDQVKAFFTHRAPSLCSTRLPSARTDRRDG